MVVGGILWILAATLLLAGNMVGRIIGVVLALLSLWANISLIAIAPVWSSIAIVLDVLVIYAIVAHGREMKMLE
jgi:hypothetical protein